ncbi:MAG: alkaline phosphatase D family protein [Parcubacteria group bacterium]
MKLNRRGALALLGGGAAAATAASSARASQKISFQHGVASGDPMQDGVVIWTRLTPADPKAERASANYVVTTANGKRVQNGRVFTSAARDFTAKVELTGLEPGREYLYWFENGGVKSPIARTRTLPSGHIDDLVLAVASCALWTGGYYNAYQAIADQHRVDAVLHLGDYIYEYGMDGYGGEIGAKIGRTVDPTHEILTLADYRRRHAQAKSDPMLQAAHARAPWIVVWDDHEVANDDWMGGAENHQPNEGLWSDRKAAALRAWYEWMPIRDPKPGRPFEAINRSFQFGDLATLIMLETRLTARTHQLDYATDMVVDGKPDPQAFMGKYLDPSRTMMGPAQEAWLADQLKASVASGHRWQVLGNQVVMARVVMPDVSKKMTAEAYGQLMANLPADVRAIASQAPAIAAAGLPYDLDAWDGYPAARERVYGMFKAANATPVVVSGDSHAFWANDLHDAAGQRVAAEFGTAGITSPGIADILVGAPINEAFEERNKEVLYTDHGAKGFVLLTLTREAATADIVGVSTVYAPKAETKVLKRFRVEPAANGVGAVTEIS